MKSLKQFLSAILIFLLISFYVTVAAAEEHPWVKELPFESGMVHYSLSGMEEGTETLYIKEYGAQTARYHTAKATMMGMTMETKTVELTDSDWVYLYDLVENTGVKSGNPTKYMIEEFNALSAADKKKAKEKAEAMGAQYAGMGTFEKNAADLLGYSCDRIAAMGTVSYVIHDSDIPLKMEMNTMGMTMNVTALSVKEGEVPGKYFQHPAGIEALHDAEGTAAAKMMAEQAVASLVDGQVAQAESATAQPRMEHIPEEDQGEMQQAMEMMKSIFGN